MKNLWQDLTYGWRLVIKAPLFSLIAIFTMAICIAANTSIFTVVNAILLGSSPYQNIDRVAWIWGTWDGGNQASLSALDLEDYKSRSKSFEQIGMFGFMLVPFNLTEGAEPERLDGYYISANFFDTLGAKPVVGRTFYKEEEEAGRDRVAILSHGLWQRRFGGDPGVLNRPIRLNGESYTVVGVMPAGVEMPKSAEIWTPLPLYMPEMKVRRAHSLRAIGVLKPAVTIAQAQAEMNILAAQLEQQYPDSNSGYGIRLVGLKEQLLGDVKTPLLMLLAATGLLLLIGCVNIANLLLARASTRQREMAIRAALGATRGRLLLQLFVESVVLSLIGGLVGVTLAFWTVRGLVQMAPVEIPGVQNINPDFRVLAVMLAVSVLSGILFGLAPALQSTRFNANDCLKDSRDGADGARGRTVRNGLVILEVALALVLLIGSGLMIRSFQRLQSVNPGFNPENVLTMHLSLPPLKYADPGKIANFYREAIQRIEKLPGVETVGMISNLPLSGESNDTYFTVEGQSVQDPRQRPVANYRIISPHYFQAIGIPLKTGRQFTEQDESGNPVVIINEALAEKYFPGVSPVGRRLVIDVGEPLTAEIVGVAGNVRHYALELAPYYEMYLPMNIFPETNLVIRTKYDELALAASVRNEIQAIDKDQPVSKTRTMSQVVVASIAEPRFRTFLLSSFAGIALLLAIIGVYGVMSYSFSQRSREMGVRMALGAQPADLLKLVLGQGLGLVSVGIVAGILGAFLLTRFISGLLYQVSSVDWLTYLGASFLLMGVALLACFIPAYRVSQIDPNLALRDE